MDIPLPEQSLAAAAARLMLEQIERLFEQEAGVRAGDDPIAFHRMRVAARRLRVAARAFRATFASLGLGEIVAVAGEELRNLATVLGTVRDRDVLIAGLRAEAEANSADRAAIERLIADQVEERRRAHVAVDAALAGGALPLMLGGLRDALNSYIELSAPARDRVRRRAPALLSAGLKRLRRRGRRIQFATAEDLHRLRIAAKRLRYTAEIFLPTFPALAEVIALTTGLQDELGGLNDEEIAIGVLVQTLERLAIEPARWADGAPIARLIAARRARRGERLKELQILWRRLPSASALRERLEEAGK